MTSKPTHTPGPWYALYDKNRDNFQIFASGRVGMRAWIATTKCESVPAHHEANARLIAAAPDMLEALEELLAMRGANWASRHMHVPGVARAVEIVAKARGEI